MYDNPVGVLTNNPTFDYHMTNLSNYQSLHEKEPCNYLLPNHDLNIYSLGMGALGLPGDFSSASRFIRAVFVKSKSIQGKDEKENIHQFFHILTSVAMPKGCVVTPNNEYEYTRYSGCCNTSKQIYYYTTYYQSEIHSVALNEVDLDQTQLYVYPLIQ